MKRLLLAAIIAALLAGCSSGNLIRSKVEKGIANVLPEYIGPAGEYTVRAEGDSTSMVRGTIRRLHIEGRDVQIDQDLTVSILKVQLDEVRYDPISRNLKSVRDTTFEAVFMEKDVNRYIERTREGDVELTVRFEPGKVHADLVPSVMGMDVLVSVAGNLRLHGFDKIDFEPDKTSVARLPVPGFAVNRVLDRINPVVDLSVMGFPVRMNHIQLRRGSVVVRGEAEFDPQQPIY